MIDYLEALIEVEEEETAPVRRVVLGKVRTANQGEKSETHSGSDAVWLDGTPDGAAVAVDDLRGENPLRADGMEVGPARSGPTDQRGAFVKSQAAGGGWLYEALTRAGQAARQVRERETAGVTVTLPETGNRSGQLNAAALDRAVERDARRYDRGFPLY